MAEAASEEPDAGSAWGLTWFTNHAPFFYCDASAFHVRKVMTEKYEDKDSAEEWLGVIMDWLWILWIVHAGEEDKIAVSPQRAVSIKVCYAMRGLVPFKQKGLPPGLAHVSLGSFGEQCAQGIDRCSRVQKSQAASHTRKHKNTASTNLSFSIPLGIPTNLCGLIVSGQVEATKKNDQNGSCQEMICWTSCVEATWPSKVADPQSEKAAGTSKLGGNGPSMGQDMNEQAGRSLWIADCRRYHSCIAFDSFLFLTPTHVDRQCPQHEGSSAGLALDLIQLVPSAAKGCDSVMIWWVMCFSPL